MGDQAQSDYNNFTQEIDAKIALNDTLVERQQQQDLEISEKERLVETRNRMLQLSYDQNMYKKKIMLTLLSVFCALLVLFVIIAIRRGKK